MSTLKGQDTDRGDRIRGERERLGLSLVDCALKTGVSKGSQRLYEKGNAPTADYLVAIGDLGADIVYILTGRSGQNVEPRFGTSVRRLDGTVISTHTGATVPMSETAAEIAEASPSELIRLPRYAVEASAGPGIFLANDQPFSELAFDRQFLRDRGASPDSCTVIQARGDSMMPTIPDGSLLIVDHSQVEVANGYITVIGVGDDLLVKRIRRRIDGMIELISDNPAYQPETVSTERLDQLRIIGRVVYFCRVP
jgi:phage repressor protein C with HTH and peptisase S24 domain